MTKSRVAPGAARSWLGWTSALLSLAYVFGCYRGLATPEGQAWWQPSGFLHRLRWLGELNDEPFAGADVFALAIAPALLGLLTFIGTRSVLARTMALCGISCSALLGFYGLHAFGPWDFFGWRGTLVILATGAAAAVACAAPLLAGSALRAPTALRLGMLAAIAFAAVATMRHATGWDPGFRFNLSPWPALAIFGLDLAGTTLAGCQIALGTALAAMRRPEPAVPLLLGGVALATAVFTGNALATGDHAHTRYVLAPRLIAALDGYLAREQVYPDSLAELVESGDLAAVPRPRIGFGAVYAIGLLERPVFEYQGLGSSYVLEFASTEWVQCAYTPPWIVDPDELEDLDEDELAELDDEPWACPDTRPDLW